MVGGELVKSSNAVIMAYFKRPFRHSRGNNGENYVNPQNGETVR